jgi:hypothetical protein
MRLLTADTLSAIERYIELNARLIDRRRFALLFQAGSAEAVLDALRAYQNADGGFGNALEPDLRGAESQPQPVEMAFHVMAEVASAGLLFDPDIVQAACHYLTTICADDGGIPFVLPSVRNSPHAPWWQTPDDPPGDLNPTAALAGLLHQHDVEHPFVEQATAFCWPRIESMTETSPYGAYPVLTFLDHVPDRTRAEAAFDRLAPLITPHVELDPEATGEVHFPLDFAPTPDGFGRRLFSDEVIDTHLDAMIDSLGEDGGWSFNWPAWTPVVRHEWGAFVTIANLKKLHAYGRLRL